jgi:hypothetical protein
LRHLSFTVVKKKTPKTRKLVSGPQCVKNSDEKYSSSIFFIQPLKMDLTEGSETSEKLSLTPGKYPKEKIQDKRSINKVNVETVGRTDTVTSYRSLQ